MIEQIYKLSADNKKTIEKVIQDENIHYMHMLLYENDELPVHFTNSNVYMTVVKGALTISLGDEPARKYEQGTVLKIPVDTKMHARNLYGDLLELIVVKAPAPLK